MPLKASQTYKALWKHIALIDPQKRGFHDIWAKTEVVVLPQAR